MKRPFLRRINNVCIRSGSQSLLIAAVAYLHSPSCSAASAASNSQNITTLPFTPFYLDGRVVATLAVAVFVYALVPVIRLWWVSRRSRKAYEAFLLSSVRSAFVRFGKQEPVSHFIQRYPDKHSQWDWLKTLQDTDLGVPEICSTIVAALEKMLTEESRQRKYIPIITYAGTGMAITELDHEHPIWLFSRRRSEIISKYLLSEAQLKGSTKEIYASPIYELAQSEHQQDRERWVAGAYQLLEELTEHYVSTLALARYLLGPKKAESERNRCTEPTTAYDSLWVRAKAFIKGPHQAEPAPSNAKEDAEPPS